MSQNNDWSAFVLMPFDPSFEPIYTDLIVPALSEIGYFVERADSPIGQRNILKEIIKKIDQASLIVADLTTLNENVMYELGIAHALLKPTVMIIQSIEDLPFDLRSYNVVPYSTHFNEIANLKNELQKVGQGRQNGDARFDNPVSDFAPSVLRLLQEEVTRTVTTSQKEEMIEEQSTWLDLVGEGVEQLGEAQEIIARITSAILLVGQNMSSRTEQLNNVQNSGLPNTTAIVYQILKAGANDLLEFAKLTENNSKLYRNAWKKFSSNYMEILNNSLILNDADLVAAGVFKTQLLGLQNTVVGSNNSVMKLRESISNLPDVSKHLTQARKLSVQAVDHLIEELTTTDASAARIINLIDNLVANYKP